MSIPHPNATGSTLRENPDVQLVPRSQAHQIVHATLGSRSNVDATGAFRDPTRAKHPYPFHWGCTGTSKRHAGITPVNSRTRRVHSTLHMSQPTHRTLAGPSTRARSRPICMLARVQEEELTLLDRSLTLSLRPTIVRFPLSLEPYLSPENHRVCAGDGGSCPGSCIYPQVFGDYP